MDLVCIYDDHIPIGPLTLSINTRLQAGKDCGFSVDIFGLISLSSCPFHFI